MLVAGFGAFDGGTATHQTGSSVDVTNQTMLVGIAAGNDTPYGRFAIGGFFEAGWASYTTSNSASGGSIKGSGDGSFYGGGILAHFAHESGVYLEGSLRAGQVDTTFSTSAGQADGSKAKTTSTLPYYGGHGGIGMLFDLPDSENAKLDVSVKGLWTHMGDGTATVDGNKVQFTSSDSFRVRLGGRLLYAFNERFQGYVGGYYEQEMGGDQGMMVNSQDVTAPSLKGGTGIGEAGVSYSPDTEIPLFVDLGISGFTGVRSGIGGGLNLRVEY
jgi:hypothetical protein